MDKSGVRYTILLLLVIALFSIPYAFAADFALAPIETMIMPASLSNNTVTHTFVVRNTGDLNLTDITFSHTINTAYQVSFSPSTIALLRPNQGQTVTLALRTLPQDEPGVNTLGTVIVQANETSESFDVRSNVSSRLLISAVDVNVDDEADSDVEEGEIVQDDAKPGSEIRLGIEVENKYSSRDDIRMEDVEIKVTIKDLDDNSDVDYDINKFDIDAGDEELKFLDFTIPIQVEEKTYEVLIEVEGEDENNIRHRDEHMIRLKVDKKSHEIVIVDIDTNPASCGEQTTMSVKIQNLGASAERDARISVTNKELGIALRETGIELDEDPFARDSEYTQAFSFKIPQTAVAKEYQLNVTAYFTSFLDDQKVAPLTVSCASTSTTTPSEIQIEDQQPTDDQQTEEIPTEETPSEEITNDSGSSESPGETTNEEVSEGTTHIDTESGVELSEEGQNAPTSSTRPVPQTTARFSPDALFSSKQNLIALTVIIMVILVGIIVAASTYFKK